MQVHLNLLYVEVRSENASILGSILFVYKN